MAKTNTKVRAAPDTGVDTGGGWAGLTGMPTGPAPATGADIMLYLRSLGGYGTGIVHDTDVLATTIQLSSPYGSTGVFPSILPPSATLQDYIDAPFTLSASELMQVQRQLWMAGYYNMDGGDPMDSMPRWGIADSALVDAWSEFLMDTARHKGTGVTGDELLAKRAQGFQQQIDRAAMMRAHVGDVTVHTTDPAEIMATAESIATERLGRRLTDDEMSAVVGVVSGGELSNAMANAGAERNAALAAAGLTSEAHGPDVAPELPTLIQAGGAESTAQTMTANLARTFGVTRSTTSRDGLQATFGGGAAYLDALTQWLEVHQGQGSAIASFRKVGFGDPDEPDRLVVTLREGASVPPVAQSASAPDRDRDLRAFLDTMRATPDSPLGYLAGEDRETRGMFGMDERQMRAIARSRGWDPDRIWDPDAQEAIARAYASDLYDDLGDWRLVALAFRSSPTTARYVARHADLDHSFLDINEMSKVDDAMGGRPGVGKGGKAPLEQTGWERSLEKDPVWGPLAWWEQRQLDAADKRAGKGGKLKSLGGDKPDALVQKLMLRGGFTRQEAELLAQRYRTSYKSITSKPTFGPGPKQMPALAKLFSAVEKGMAHHARTADAGVVPMQLDDVLSGAMSGNVGGGGVIVEPGYNPAARTLLEMENRHGNEMSAHHLSTLWDEFMNTMQTPADESAVVDNPGSL